MGVLHNPMLSLIILILSYNLSFSVLSIAARNTITPNQSLSDGQTLVSPNQVFALGFFTPNGSTYSYLGIWYNKIPGQTAVWVGNREAPLEITPNATLSLTSEGNLAVRNHKGEIIWSTPTSNMSNPVVQLLDSGNLVLTDDGYVGSDNSSIVWQSFDYPTDTLLPGMQLGWDLKANRERRLTSWLSNSDPSPGPYSYGVDISGAVPELYIWDGSETESRGDPPNNSNTSSIDPTFSMQFITTNDAAYYTYEILNSSFTLRIVLNELGFAKILSWQSQKWVLRAESPANLCDTYGECGVFGVCNIDNSPICSCLKGFEPKFPANWALRDFSGGCEWRAPLDYGDGGGFVMFSGVQLPATKEAVLLQESDLDSCKEWCQRSHSCFAFAFLNDTSACISWFEELMDIKNLPRGDNLYVKLAASKLGGSIISPAEIYPRKRRRAPVVVLVAVSLAVIISFSLMLLIWIRRKHRWMSLSTENIILPFGNGRQLNLRGSDGTLASSHYPFSSIIQATDNFSYKLGEGGFGPVYKGQLIEGHEIAVKRLAGKSAQGREEFENEITLIAKLQHRNLVRLLGYCIHGEEKLLIHEYMPNKSLDYFLFDTTRRAQLDWSRRLNTIEGISQGLLYLHKHSRLRIIHRDLKASNILLDADMNPKISDFGMARIFGSNETEANTNRIVGTYGYMSPEYAAEGIFSIKSDVFSFGVLLLEIVSGSKNTCYHRHGNTLNLPGYAWELWKDAKWLELVDPSLGENCPKHEISRCIHVALMCVQENAIDRPDMSSVIAMLSRDSAIADPKQPAFFNIRNPPEEELCSVNEVTVTDIKGR